MAESSGSGAPIVTGSVAFYRKPEPLAADRHGKLGVIRQEKPYLFVKDTYVVPITFGEFQLVGLDYPIIFGGPERTPLAVMGLRQGQNLFVDEDGGYEPYRYIPAFIRRYPFVFAEDKVNRRFIACIDVEAPMVRENADLALFEGTEPTQFTRSAVDFLTGFEQQRRQTEAFVKELAALDLFDNAQITYTQMREDGSQGPPMSLADYIGVSFDKLKALPQDKLSDLMNKGYLGAIHLHFHSLSSWQWLMRRAERRLATTNSAVN
jgi:hypothetical protein